VIEAVNRVRTPFNVNSLAQIAALAALQDEPYMHACIAQCAAARDKLVDSLSAADMPCLPTVANFIAVDVGSVASDFVTAMAEQNIFVNPLGPTHPNHIRVTVGSTQDNQQFLDAAVRFQQTGAAR